MEKRRMMTLGAAILGVMAMAVLLWAAGNVGASPPMGPLAQGGAPLLLNYQGRLADPTTSLPKPDGTYNITFNIHDAETDGTLIWSETQVVEVTRVGWTVGYYLNHLASNPKDHQARVALARSYLHEGDLDRAVFQYRELVSSSILLDESIDDLEATADDAPDHLPTHELFSGRGKV